MREEGWHALTYAHYSGTNGLHSVKWCSESGQKRSMLEHYKFRFLLPPQDGSVTFWVIDCQVYMTLLYIFDEVVLYLDIYLLF